MSSVSPTSLMNLSSSLSTLKLGSCGLGPEFMAYLPLSSRLISLDLSDNDLQLDMTSFNQIVRNLSRLRELDLSYVDLSSVSFRNLSSSLSVLKLRSSGLGGKFPDIFHLSELGSLDLSENAELAIDKSAFNKLAKSLSNLKELDMSSMNMSLVEPVYLLNLSSSLSRLYLNDCGLRGGFPAILLQRPYLKKLALRGNDELNGSLPNSNWSSSLQLLDLSYTKIPIFLKPDFFNNLKLLKQLYLIGCNFVGTNLELFGNLSNLTLLDLSSNNFSDDIPSSFQNLKLLKFFSIRNNSFSGPIPDYFENFKQLIILSVTYNRLTGSINSVARALSNLVFLNLSVNFLNGTIPSSLFTLPFLEYLLLNDNQLNGGIDTSQINSNSLYRIDLSNNKLSGKIPRKIQSNSIAYIDLSNNKLQGSIPDSLCELHFLEILDFSNNSLNGFILPCLGNLSNVLLVLHFGMNNFEGTFPDTFSQSCRLKYLNLGANKLQGQIPLSIINCKHLELIDLGNNKMDDTFPYFLETLPHLQVLVLRSNKLYGLVKTFSLNFSFPKLRILDLSNNKFNGPLPAWYFDRFEAMMNSDNGTMNDYMDSFPNYTYSYSVSLTFKGVQMKWEKIQTLLTNMDLSCNNFKGSIPKSIGKLKLLKQLNLSHNRLAGNIEPSLGNLTNLESLDLSSNLLTGKIPLQLRDLTFREVFRVSFNRLEGSIPQGKQFNTFDKSSYEGNSELCGFPLEKCRNKETRNPTPSEEDEKGFGWKSILVGYGCGVVFGVEMGYVVFRTRNPAWFVRMVEGNPRFRRNRQTS